MNPNLVNNFGQWWLSGPKYDISKQMAGPDWNVNIEQALNKFGRTLANATNLHDVLKVFQGKEFWKADGWYQLQDVVLPPARLLANGGDDCDGWAMAHAQAIEFALSRFGWRAVIVSYLADPWWVSHHFALATDPNGLLYAVQPQPTEEQWKLYGPNMQLVYGPFTTVDQAVTVVAAMYQAKPVWYDQRGCYYQTLP